MDHDTAAWPLDALPQGDQAMKTTVRLRIESPGFGLACVVGVLVAALVAGQAGAARAKEPALRQAVPKDGATKTCQWNSRTLGSLLRLAGCVAMPGPKGLLADKTLKFLASNRDNHVVLKPLSGNRIETFSHNRPKIVVGDTVKVLSDIQVNVNINVQVGNGREMDAKPTPRDKADATFKRLDRNVDRQTHPRESREPAAVPGS
jgi:hypothetical protein